MVELIWLAQAGSDVEVLKYVLGSGSGAAIAGVIAYFMFRALLQAHSAHLMDLQKQLEVTNVTHTKHLEKEGQVVEAMSGLRMAVDGLKEEIKDMRIEHERGPLGGGR